MHTQVTPMNTTLPYDRPDRRSRRLNLPDFPQEEWCDFRRDYESGMTLKQIAEKYICDPRTVRQSMLRNTESSCIGHRRAPTILAPYLSIISEFANQNADSGSICRISRELTGQLREAGYTGSERTVRNYLRNYYHVLKIGKEE